MQEGVPHISEAQAVFLEKFFNFRGTITELAAAMDVPLVDMIDILSAPAIRSRINNAKIITELKRDLIAARAEMAALETLQQITSDRHIIPLERRRAATAILRATRPIRARSQSRSQNSFLPRACGGGGGGGRFPEAGGGPSGHTDHNNQTSNPTDVGDPPLIPAVDPAIYIPEEEIASLRKQTTQAPTEELAELHEICTQEDTPTAAASTNNQSSQDRISPQPQGLNVNSRVWDAQRPTHGQPTIDSHDPDGVGIPTSTQDHSKTNHPGPSGANESCHGWSSDEVGTEPVENKQNDTVPEGRTKRTQTQNGSNPPQKPTHKTPIPEKDNPWESHPFARADRCASEPRPSQSSPNSVPSCLKALVPSPPPSPPTPHQRE